MGGASNDRYSCILKVGDTNFSLKKIAKTLIGYFAKRRTLAYPENMGGMLIRIRVI